MANQVFGVMTSMMHLTNENLIHMNKELTSTNVALDHINNNLTHINDTLMPSFWIKAGTIANSVMALFALLAIIVSLYTANKSYFDSKFKKLVVIFKPSILIYDSTINTQRRSNCQRACDEYYDVVRIIIKNTSINYAKNVSFYVTKLYYVYNDGCSEANNFLPFPLSWTHYNNEYRDLHYNVPTLLNICESSGRNSHDQPVPVFCVTTQSKARDYGLSDLEIGYNRIVLTQYCDNHEPVDYGIDILFAPRAPKPIEIKVLGKIVELIDWPNCQIQS